MTSAPSPKYDGGSWFTRAARHHLDASPLNQSFRLLRGQPTTWQRMLADAELPAVVDGHIQRIAQNTRVLPFERASFVAELIGHCQDGLDAGVDADDVARSLGPPAKVGKLAARALRRKRPATVRAFFAITTALQRGVVTAVSIYGVFAVWFFARSPVITTDHLAELRSEYDPPRETEGQAPGIARVSARIDAIVEQRAMELGYASTKKMRESEHHSELSWWPHPGALDDMTKYPFTDEEPNEDELRARAIEFVELVDRADDVVRELHRIAEIEHLDASWTTSRAEVEGSDEPDGIRDALYNLLLPHLGRYRWSTQLLNADAAVAATRGDADRFVADVVAITRLARTLGDHEPFLISDLVAQALYLTATQRVRFTLADHPDLLDAHHLAELSAALDADLVPTIEGNRRMAEDLAQRSYAPGPGARLTLDGFRLLRHLDAWDLDHDGTTEYFKRGAALSAPFFAPTMASRGTTLRRSATLQTAFEAAVDQVVISPSAWSSLEDAANPPGLDRDPLFQILQPTVGRLVNGAQSARSQRDATRLALELYRHRAIHGDFPTDDCRPLLPTAGGGHTLAIDRFDGQPMRYRLDAGVPVIYSIGPDRDDDFGRLPTERARRIANTRLDDFKPNPHASKLDGDWVLFPIPDDDGLERARAAASKPPR